MTAPERLLFGRTWLLTVGDLDVSALDLTFNVAKSTAREPNTADIRVLNLSRENRARLENAERPQVVLHAGYEEDGDPPPVLFVGAARRIYSEPSGLDIVTNIQASDSGREVRTARISRSYPPGAEISRVLRDAVEALGIGVGNLADFEAAYTARNGATVFPNGYAADGPARRVVQDLVRAAGLRWSVQNGNFQLLRVGQALQSEALRLTGPSGLVGTPTKDETGKVAATVLLQPGVEPGRRVVMASSTIEGGYEVRQTVYKGDTAGTDWHATLELAPLA
jgi:hypothetical protein